jgi:hypothetical protein
MEKYKVKEWQRNQIEFNYKIMLLNRIEKIIKRVEEEIGHTNGLYVASTILTEINKLRG